MRPHRKSKISVESARGINTRFARALIYVFVFAFSLSFSHISSADFIRWTQSSGLGMADGSMLSNGSYVNQYDSSTPINTVLSQGMVEQIENGLVEQTVDYRVTLQESNLLFYKEADDLTNNAFVIHANGQADWYSAITGSGMVALKFEFFERQTNYSIPEAVEMSLTSPHIQPDAVDVLASEVKKLHYNEVYDIQMLGGGASYTRTFTDEYNQLQQGIGAGLMTDGTPADFSLGWAEPGFGNDSNGDGNLDVGEALFTYDMSEAESFIISRSFDNGKRSALGFTAEGFFGGTTEPPVPPTVPEPSTLLLLVLGLCMLAPRRNRSRI